MSPEMLTICRDPAEMETLRMILTDGVIVIVIYMVVDALVSAYRALKAKSK